jgi:uncharacterized protein YbbC (DUF1343 family)
MVSLGIEELLKKPPAFLNGKRLGLLCNQASTDRYLNHSRDLIEQAFPGQLTCILSPQHGFFADKQDNMVESDHTVDQSGLPVFSLYSATRKPEPHMLEHFDLLLVDLIDVGTRVYTFLYTVANCLEAAAEHNKGVVILDRPNPLGGLVIEGNILQPSCKSFVGMYPIPMRHGLTLGELGLLINHHMGPASIKADLTVVPMAGWRRDMYFSDTGLPWLFPSPNMPTPVTALVYPGQVIWEGTNISEGRGTALPFEVFGAPFIDHDKLLARVGEQVGCILRPLMFEPTSNKWAGQQCVGFQIHVTDKKTFRSYCTSLSLLQAIMQLYPDDFQYKPPPYEYEHERLPMDLILGDAAVRSGLEQGTSVTELEKMWQPGLKEFDALRKKTFLYD